MRSRTTLATVVALITLAAPAAAHAEVRSATQADPADQVAPNADLEQVGVTYDRDAGALTITVRLYGAMAEDPAAAPALEVMMGEEILRPIGSGVIACHAVRLRMTARLDVTSRASLRFRSASVPVATSRSPDGRDLTVSATDARLARLDLRCFTAAVRMTAADDLLDSVAIFPGFGPPPPPACGDGLDNDGDGAIDHRDIDCLRLRTAESSPAFPCSDGQDNDADGRKDGTDAGCVATRGAAEADPALTPSALTISGLRAVRASATTCRLTIRMTLEADVPGLLPRAAATLGIRGLSRQVRTFRRTLQGTPLGLAAPGRTVRLRPGRYRFTARYPGDRFRRPSTAGARTFAVTCGIRRR